MVKQLNHDYMAGSEHRRTTRLRLDIPAIVLHEGIQVLTVKIEDFCHNGLFLVAPDQTLPAYLYEGSIITIQCETPLSNGNSNCTLDAKIIRLSRDGIGAQLIKESPKVMNLFRQYSEQRFASGSEAGSNALSDKRKTTQFVLDIINRYLPVLAENSLDECYDVISNRMASPESNHFANRYFEALTELKKHQQELIDEFLQAYTTGLNSDNQLQQQVETQGLNQGLSLVEQDEFEDWLAIQEMSRRIDKRLDTVLEQLNTQLSQTVALHNDQQEPILAPIMLCSAFNKAFCQLQFDGATRALIYPGIEEGLQNNLESFYTQISQELSEQGYLPVTRQPAVIRVPRNRGQSNPTNASAEVAASAPETAVVQDAANLQPAPIAPPAANVYANDINTLTHVFQSMQSALPQLHHAQPPNQVQAIQSVDDVQLLVNNLVPAQASGQNALSAIKDRILHELLIQQGGQQVVNQQKSASLLATSQMFDALNSQGTQPETQSYIEQLQLPLLHHALVQSENSQQNPDIIQNIIDLLDQVINLLGDSEKPWAVETKSRISKLVKQIVSESTDKPEVFKQVEAELEGFANKAINDRSKNEQKLIDDCEGKQRVRKARYRVNQELDQLIGGKRIPSVIPRLLKSGWKQILVRTELREGLGSEEWQEAIGVIKDLKTWLSRPKAIHDIPEKQIQHLLDLTNEQFTEYGIDTVKQNAIIGELVTLLLGSGTPRKIRRARLTRIKSNVFASENETDQEACPWVDDLKVNQWLEFKSDRKQAEILKLVWIGKKPWRAVFVTQQGVKRYELNRQQLIDKYQHKTVRKIENPDQPIATRARHAVVEKFYSDIRQDAFEDSKVDLLNRRGLMSFLRETEFDDDATLIFVEIDDYRVISQACGIEASDEIIIEISKRMRQSTAKNATIARIDDQSLVMVLPDTSVDSFNAMASGWSENIRNKPFEYGSQSFPVVLSIGMVGFNPENLEVEKLIKNASVTCASAKQSGRNHIKVYSDDDWQLQQRAEQLEWAGHIDKTLAENRLVLACQPIVPVNAQSGDNQSVTGQHYEILLRVVDAQGRIGPPGSFLSAGEQLRRMPDIDRWVFRNLMQWMQDNIELVDQLDGFSVNLSGQSVASQSFLNYVTEQVFEVNFDPSKLTFEITETVAIDDFEYVKKFIHHMKKLGCKFSLDDFGSGYASYSYLRNLDVDYLKIDGMFVKELHVDSKDFMMVRSMNDIAQSLGLKTIAEFVENQEILDLLGQIGVDYAQGYHVGKPAPISELVRSFEDSQLEPAE
ncbi:MAG: DUF1631 family protein [Gammaproteobacteria bacterium]|nr:DUF1631 family protein [Gammaproteobacteria bacterium]